MTFPIIFPISTHRIYTRPFYAPLLCSVFLSLAVCPALSYAQTQTPSYDDKLSARGETQLRTGTKRTILEGKMWIPLVQDHNQVFYNDTRVSGDWDDNLEGNIGFGYRFMQDQDHIIGANIWYDRRKSERGTQFNQITFGGEIMTKDFDFRTNVYLPFNEERRFNTGGAVNTTPYLQDTGIYYDVDGSLVEKSLKGIDIEAGYRLPIWEDKVDRVRILGAGYGFTADNVDSVLGGRVRAQVDVTSDISIGGRYQYDGARGSQAFADVTFRFPFGNKRNFQENGLRARMDEFSERDIDIVTSEKNTPAQIAVPVVNAETKQAQRVLYVNNASVVDGDGSLENPFNTLKSAELALKDADTIYIFEGTGDTTNMDKGLVVTQDNVSVIGSGVDFGWLNGKYTAGGQNFNGTVLLQATSNPIITNTDPFDAVSDANAGNGVGNGVLVTGSNAFLSGFTVDGANGNGVMVWADGTNIDGHTIVDRVSVFNTGRRGIYAYARNNGHMENFQVSNSHVENAGIRSIELISFHSTVEKVEFINNTAINTLGSSHAVNVQSSGTSIINHSRIIGNYIETAPLSGIVHASFTGAILLSEIEDNYITNMGTNDFTGISINLTTGLGTFVIRSNIIDGTRRDGIRLAPTGSSSASFLLEGNTVTNSGTLSNGVKDYYGVRLSNTSTGNVVYDLGGGSLGSKGGNRIYGNTVEDIYVDIGNAELSAQHNWWGEGNDLDPARALLVGDSTIDTSDWLTVDPNP